jgi:hypothetical protein
MRRLRDGDDEEEGAKRSIRSDSTVVGVAMEQEL